MTAARSCSSSTLPRSTRTPCTTPAPRSPRNSPQRKDARPPGQAAARRHRGTRRSGSDGNANARNGTSRAPRRPAPACAGTTRRPRQAGEIPDSTTHRRKQALQRPLHERRRENHAPGDPDVRRIDRRGAGSPIPRCARPHWPRHGPGAGAAAGSAGPRARPPRPLLPRPMVPIRYTAPDDRNPRLEPALHASV